MAYTKFRKDLLRTSEISHDRDVLRYQLQYILQKKKIGDDWIENTWFNGVRDDSIDNMIYDLSIPSILREYQGKRALKRDYSEFVISWKNGEIEQKDVIDYANEIVRDFLTEYDDSGNIVFDGKDAVYMMASHLDQKNGNPHVHVICSKVNPLTSETFKCLLKQDRVVKLRESSDKICLSHGQKVLDTPLYSAIGKTMSWEEYQARRHNRSFKGQIENVIEEGLKVVTTFEELITYLKRHLEIEEKSLLGNPNYIKLKMPNSKVYTRLRSLSMDYKYSSIMDRLAHKEEKVVTTFHEDEAKDKAPKYINIMDEKFANSPGLRRWANKQNFQTSAAALRASSEIEKSGTTISELRESKKNLQIKISDKDYLLNDLNERRGKLVSLKKSLEIDWKLNILPVIMNYKKISNIEAKNAYKRQNYRIFKQFDSINKTAKELGVNAKRTDESIKLISEEIKKIEYEYHDLYNERKDLNKQIQEINKALLPTQYTTDITKNKSRYKSKTKSKQSSKSNKDAI